MDKVEINVSQTGSHLAVLTYCYIKWMIFSSLFFYEILCESVIVILLAVILVMCSVSTAMASELA